MHGSALLSTALKSGEGEAGLDWAKLHSDNSKRASTRTFNRKAHLDSELVILGVRTLDGQVRER
jgi:hypothetical protein